jgi:hypothetical protein
VGRRPDHWDSPHERARVRAAERLDGPLQPAEADWLATHLAGCQECQGIAEAYAEDRLALRELRHDTPEPPRDLWARTAAGIERESSKHGEARRPGRRAGGRRASLPALGALSGLSIVTVAVIATAVSGGFLGRIGTDRATSSAPPVALASQSPQALPTAIAVGAGRVQWLGSRADGAFAYNVADIDAVCPHDRQPDCAPFADGNARRVTLTATPKYVFQSPVDDQAVIVGTDAAGSDAVIVVALPTPEPTPEPTPDATPDPTSAGSTAPLDSPPSTESPTPVASASAIPTDTPFVAPSDVVVATLAATSEPAASGSGSPQPDGSTAVAIMTDVIVVGRSAAYSPDGAWFAFSARPVDGSVGPDIYVWHVGDGQARPLTTDHASAFASWVGGSLLGSRVVSEVVMDPEASPAVDPTLEIPPPIDVAPVDPAPSTDPLTGQAVPQTFLLDPWTGAEVPLLEAEWQPAVDPTGRAVVAWQGTMSLGADGFTASPAVGNLVVHPFHGPLASDDPTSSPTAPVASTPSASPDGSVEGLPPAPEPIPLDFPTQIVVAGPITDFDARWDDTGSWLGIWIADPIDPTIGRLSLLRFDPATGLLDRPAGAPQDVTALPGFSIELGRLAWVTPPGQSGEGSRIQIAAWTSDEVGAIESVPIEGAIVIQ